MQAILLAGGLGTRLRSVVSDRPKPMALIQDKPFMEYVIQELKKQGIDEIIFAVGYKGSNGGRVFWRLEAGLKSLLLTLMRKNCLAQRERSRMRPVL